MLVAFPSKHSKRFSPATLTTALLAIWVTLIWRVNTLVTLHDSTVTIFLYLKPVIYFVFYVIENQ